MKHSQEEIDQTYDDLMTGKYAHAPAGSVKAEIIPSDKSERIVSLPVDKGTDRAVYISKSSGPWEEIDPAFFESKFA